MAGAMRQPLLSPELGDTERRGSELRPLSISREGHSLCPFHFQQDNVLNQHEHITMVVANRAERIMAHSADVPAAAAVSKAIKDFSGMNNDGGSTGLERIGTFDSYLLWCNQLGVGD